MNQSAHPLHLFNLFECLTGLRAMHLLTLGTDDARHREEVWEEGRASMSSLELPHVELAGSAPNLDLWSFSGNFIANSCLIGG